MISSSLNTANTSAVTEIHQGSTQTDSGVSQTGPATTPDAGMPETPSASSGTWSHVRTALVAGAVSATVASAVTFAAYHFTTVSAAGPVMPSPSPIPPIEPESEPSDVSHPSVEAGHVASLVINATIHCVKPFFQNLTDLVLQSSVEDAVVPRAIQVGEQLIAQGVNVTQLQPPVEACLPHPLPGESAYQMAYRGVEGPVGQLFGQAYQMLTAHMPAPMPIPLPAPSTAAVALVDAVGVMALTVAVHTLGLF